jgi:hypothetical protein
MARRRLRLGMLGAVKSSRQGGVWLPRDEWTTT